MHPNITKKLTEAGVNFNERLHASFPQPINSPADFAKALDYDIGRVTKTLFLTSGSKEGFYLAVLSSNKRLNLELLATLANVKKLTFGSKADLASQLGYPPTGVSPIAPQGFKVFLDKELLKYPSILIGGGEVGAEVEINPIVLGNLTNAVLGEIAMK